MRPVRWETAARLFVAALLTGLCLAPAAWAGPRVTLTSPHPHQVFQRDGHDHAGILVSGRGAGFDGPVQVRWGDGDWHTVPRGADGSFSAVLAHRSVGQKTVTVRSLRSPSCTTSVRFVGVGDIYVVAGQSNAVGVSGTLFAYSNPTLRAGLFGNDYLWGDLRDPTDSARGQIDQVSADLDTGGSVWPGVATALMAAEHVPVAFVPCARTGSTIVEWQRQEASPWTAASLYGSMARRIAAVGGKVRAVLFWQGEADARLGTTGADYQTALWHFTAAVRRDFGCRVLVAQIGDYCAEKWTGADIGAIRLAQQHAWGRHAALAGPLLYDVDLGDKIHFLTPAAVHTAARRWAAAILAGVLKRPVAHSPRLTAAVYDGDRTITLRFDSPLVRLRRGLAGGVVVESPAGPVSPVAERVVSAHRVVITLDAPVQGPLSVSLGADRTAAGALVPADASKWRLPSLLFVGWPVALVAP
jgi:hypothetical protein